MASKRVATMIAEQCVACGACMGECPKGAVSVFRGCYAVVAADLCIGCGRCAKVCPAGCITVTERGTQA